MNNKENLLNELAAKLHNLPKLGEKQELINEFKEKIRLLTEKDLNYLISLALELIHLQQQ